MFILELLMHMWYTAQRKHILLLLVLFYHESPVVIDCKIINIKNCVIMVTN